MTDRNRIRARVMAKRIHNALPVFGEARAMFASALAGECSAFDALCEAPCQMRGQMLVTLFYAGVSGLGRAFCAAWGADHLSLRRVARAEGDCFAALVHAAGFAPSPDLPDVVRVWRGTRGVNLHTASRGLSWTTDRDGACYIAMGRPGSGFAGGAPGEPLVVRRDVSRADIIGALPRRDDGPHGWDEYLIDLPTDAQICGTIDDWRPAAYRTAALGTRDAGPSHAEMLIASLASGPAYAALLIAGL